MSRDAGDVEIVEGEDWRREIVSIYAHDAHDPDLRCMREIVSPVREIVSPMRNRDNAEMYSSRIRYVCVTGETPTCSITSCTVHVELPVLYRTCRSSLLDLAGCPCHALHPMLSSFCVG